MCSSSDSQPEPDKAKWFQRLLYIRYWNTVWAEKLKSEPGVGGGMEREGERGRMRGVRGITMATDSAVIFQHTFI